MVRNPGPKAGWLSPGEIVPANGVCFGNVVSVVSVRLDPVEVAIAQAEAMLPLVSRAFELAAVERPEIATDTEHLNSLISVADGAITMLGVFVDQWRTVRLSEKC
jgi:hypothetical protein